jgi:hypothetical protein
MPFFVFCSVRLTKGMRRCEVNKLELNQFTFAIFMRKKREYILKAKDSFRDLEIKITEKKN